MTAKCKWIKGQDFMDGSPRYTLEGTIPVPRYCNFPDSEYRWSVGITSDREREYPGGPKRRYYRAFIHDCHKESSIESDRFISVKSAKAWAEQSFIEAKYAKSD